MQAFYRTIDFYDFYLNVLIRDVFCTQEMIDVSKRSKMA